MCLAMLGADPEAAGTGWQVSLSLPGLADGVCQHYQGPTVLRTDCVVLWELFI